MEGDPMDDIKVNFDEPLSEEHMAAKAKADITMANNKALFQLARVYGVENPGAYVQEFKWNTAYYLEYQLKKEAEARNAANEAVDEADETAAADGEEKPNDGEQ